MQTGRDNDIGTFSLPVSFLFHYADCIFTVQYVQQMPQILTRFRVQMGMQNYIQKENEKEKPLSNETVCIKNV